ncbi:MAG: electron transport complex subunit RsxC [Pseudomonadota bacterium]
MDTSSLSFSKGGIHLREHKELAERHSIENMPLPEEVFILLNQHFGAPAVSLVKKKDIVAEGDLIGTVEKGPGASIHSSISGTIKGIVPASHPLAVSAPAILVERDPQAEPRQFARIGWNDLSREEMLTRIKNAGIVGMGGAGFPTHVKLSPPPTAKMDVLILNGAECEPYLTGDHRLMIEHPVEIIEGAMIILKLLGLRTCFIGVEDNKPDAIRALNAVLKDNVLNRNGFDISVKPLLTKYPQGSEKQLIQTITGRKVPGFGLPFDVGVTVQNVSTVRAIYEAVALGRPLYERIVTISGRGIKRQANLLVRIGTRLSDIVSYLGGVTDKLRKVVMGGPMMGFAVSTLDIPVMKTTSGVVFLTDEETDVSGYGQCIRCGWCIDACPMGLSPNEIGVYVEAGKSAETGQFGVFECFECGCCAYVCPAKRPLVQFVRIAKTKAKR